MKSSTTLATLLAIGAVNAASITSELGDVSSKAANMKQMVDKWTSSSGLQGALGVQQKFPDLQSSVKALNEAVSSATDVDIEPSSIKDMVSHVNGLLSSLSKKGGDFKTVGAQDIVKQDISSMAITSEQVVNGLIKAVSSDCTKVDELNPTLKSFASGFQNAKDVYGFSGGDFPSQITCSSKEGASSGSKVAAGSKQVDHSYSSTTTAIVSSTSQPSSGTTAATSPTSSVDPSSAAAASEASDASSAVDSASASASAKVGNHTKPALANGSPSLDSAAYLGMALIAVPLLI